MTNYGTIPTSTSPSSGTAAATHLEYISRAKARIRAGLGTRRPWKLMLDRHGFSFPSSAFDALRRLRTNGAFFRVNYAIVGLGVLFLSLLWFPISLIVFLVMAAVWIFLYFLRDEPLVFFGRTIGDGVVLGVLSVVTVAALLFTGATLNILVALVIAAAVLAIHAVFRKTEDLFLDEENAGLMAGVASSSSS